MSVPGWLTGSDQERAQVTLSHSLGGMRATTLLLGRVFTIEDYQTWRELPQRDVEIVQRLWDEAYLWQAGPHPRNPLSIDGDRVDLFWMGITPKGLQLLDELIALLYPEIGKNRA